MTITTRSKIKLFSLCLAFLVASFAIFSYVVSLISHSYLALPQNILEFSVNSLFMLRYSPLAVSTVILLFSISSFLSLFYTYFAFRKIQSTEMFFFELFLFSLNWEALRLLVPYFAFSPVIMAELSSISRFLYFFRFMALFSLLGMSLFSTINITRQKTFIVALFIFTSLMLSMSIPLDSTEINYLFLAGQPFMTGYLTLLASASIFLILTLVIYYLYERILERLHMIGSCVSLVVGYTVLLFAWDYWRLCFGIFFFLYGTFNIIKNIHSIYLWK